MFKQLLITTDLPLLLLDLGLQTQGLGITRQTGIGEISRIDGCQQLTGLHLAPNIHMQLHHTAGGFTDYGSGV